VHLPKKDFNKSALRQTHKSIYNPTNKQNTLLAISILWLIIFTD